MTEKKVSRSFLFLLFLFLTLAAYCLFLFRPLWARYGEATREHEADTRLIGSYRLGIAQMDSIEKRVAELQAKKDEAAKLPGILPSAIGEDAAKGLKSAGVSADSLSVGDEAAVPGAKKSSSGLVLYGVPVTLSLRCTLPQLDTLADYFERRAGGAYWVDSVSWTAVEGAPGQCDAKLAMTMYRYGEAAPAASSPAPK